MTTADQDIQTLTDQLGLTNVRQDWGICNADAGRVEEFIRVCRTGGLTQPQQYAMCDLVLASMNEALVDGTTDEELFGQFKTFLTLHLHGMAAQVHY